MIATRTRATIALCAMASLFIANRAKAQNLFGDKFSLAIGGEIGVVTGDEANYRSFDIGIALQAQYRLTDKIAFTVTSGLYNFLSKYYTAIDPVFGGGPYGTPSGFLGIIPFKGGIRVFTSKHFYLSAEAGYWIEPWGDDYYTVFPSYLPQPKESKLLLAGGCGWFLKNLDVGFRYDSFLTQIAGYNSVYWGIATFHVAYIIR